MKIATWNVNSLRVRLQHVLDWLAKTRPTILGLQETKLVDEEFPAREFLDAGYQVAFSGQKTYNGVALISLLPLQNIGTEFPGYSDRQKRILYADAGNVTVLNIYVPNGSEVGSEKFLYKLEWLRNLRKFTQATLLRNEQLIIVGDFNIAPADADVHDPGEWRDKVLCSPDEREEFGALAAQGLVDCFRLFPRESKQFSWWDYRAASFRRNRGLRIDHILASEAMAARCTGCEIDTVPRRLERPSDHAPVIAEFSE